MVSLFYCIYRSSHQGRFFKRGVLERFCKDYRKTPVSESLLNKAAGPQGLFILKRLYHRSFYVSFAKCLRALFNRTPSAAASAMQSQPQNGLKKFLVFPFFKPYDSYKKNSYTKRVLHIVIILLRGDSIIMSR